MATMTLSKESIDFGVRRSITLARVVKYLRSIVGGEKTTQQDMDAFEAAINNVKLAAEPGETYAAVAARIKLEAEMYREFLLHPKPIGKISLIVKEIDPRSRDFNSPRKQYQVHDPAEGWASVSYKFDYSDSKVLEFIMYDTKGSRLFAITRSYSNWIGYREFNLGLNRVFCLNMAEDSPGRVMVDASFRTAEALEGAHVPQRRLEPVRQIAAPVAKIESGRSLFEFRPFRRRLAWVLVLQCMLISLICSTVSSVATSRAIARQGSLATVNTDVSGSHDAIVALSAKPSDETSAIAVGTSTNSSDAVNATNTKDRLTSAQKATRLAKVERFSVSVDNDSCKSNESRCLELLSSVQKRVHSSLSGISLRVYAPDQTNKSTELAQLVVSYNPIDTLHGQIHLTLYDGQGELWDDKGNLTYAAIAQPAVVDNYCEEASSKILWEIITAKIRVNSNPQQGEKASE